MFFHYSQRIAYIWIAAVPLNFLQHIINLETFPAMKHYNIITEPRFFRYKISFKYNIKHSTIPWKGGYALYNISLSLDQYYRNPKQCLTLYPLRRKALFPKLANEDSLPVYNIPFESHWSAYLRTDISSYEGGSHFERNCLKCETEQFAADINSQIS